MCCGDSYDVVCGPRALAVYSVNPTVCVSLCVQFVQWNITHCKIIFISSFSMCVSLCGVSQWMTVGGYAALPLGVYVCVLCVGLVCQLGVLYQ